jgi:LL-diaminopimelate aminotransferase
LAVLNPGEAALIPEPGYPVYAAGTTFAGGEGLPMPLREANGWFPDWKEIPREVRRRTRLLFLNYPNNPTGACASRTLFEEAVAFARECGALLAHDAAYAEVYFDDPPPSVLEIDGAKEVCIEFHSLSKTFNMTGWRVGFAVGNPGAIASLAKVKNNVDSGVFGAIQEAAVAALEGVDRPEAREQREAYRRRRDVLTSGLREAGWSVQPPKGGFFVWARAPAAGDSMGVVSQLLEKADVVAIPGGGFGPCGEGYVRFALTVSEERTRQAVERIKKLYG